MFEPRVAYAAVVLRAVDADEHAVRQHRPARLLRAAVEALSVACPGTEGIELRVDLLVGQAGGVLHGLSLAKRLLLDVLALHGQEVRHSACACRRSDDAAVSDDASKRSLWDFREHLALSWRRTVTV